MSQLRQKVSAESPGAQLVAEIDNLLEKAGEYTRSLMAKLNPPVLDELGLPSALTWLAKQMPLHGLLVEVRLFQEQVPLPDDQSVLLFQSVRELLINVAKHAGTDRAIVSLRVDRPATFHRFRIKGVGSPGRPGSQVGKRPLRTFQCQGAHAGDGRPARRHKPTRRRHNCHNDFASHEGQTG
jgi:glucose-6-phosphate-specific signal transduction histidine kinase